MAAAIVVHMAWKRTARRVRNENHFFSYFSDQKFHLWLHEKKAKLLIL